MKKTTKILFCITLCCTVLLSGLPFSTISDLAITANAAQEGIYTYEINDGKARITSVNKSISGKVTIPSKLGGYPVVETGNFWGCEKITEITIPDSITVISSESFYLCKGLTQVNIPDSVTHIRREAFYSCTSLKEITIPDSVKQIDMGAFRECTSLTEIIIPDTVDYVGMGAFNGCEKLADISIPGYTLIENDAFEGTAYHNNEANWEKGFLYIDNHLVDAKPTVSGQVVIKEGTKTISGFTFFHCKITEIIIPDSVRHIGEGAFSGCKSLTQITIPGSVERIRDYTFDNCTGLEKIVISEGVKGISAYSFPNCYNLSKIIIPDSVTNLEENFEDTSYYKNILNWQNGILYIGNHLVAAQKELFGIVVIKDGTKIIAGNAFSDCKNISAITLSDSVTVIGNFSFSGCQNISEVVLPDSVESISDSAFSDCSNLEKIKILNPQTDIRNFYAESFHVWDRSIIPENTVIYGYEGSTAEEYAKTYNKKFVTLQEIEIEKSDNICSLNKKCVAAISGITVEQLLNHVEDDVTVTDKDGKAVYLTDNVKSGMRLILKDKDNKIINTAIVVVPGDVDSDGNVTAGDARLALRASVGLEKLNNWQKDASNLEKIKENKITAADARLILRASVGLEDLSACLKTLK